MKFNFAKACAAMLVDLGAVEVEYHVPQFEINTVAGVLTCTPFETWLACRFDDEREAVRLITEGCLNRYSGKWNWHFVKPDEVDLGRLRASIERILIKESV